MNRQYLETVGVIVSVVRNVQMLRAFKELYEQADQNYWNIVGGNFLDIAVIEWCKLFGSDHKGHQPVHWKNIVKAEFHQTFRDGLLKSTSHDVTEWKAYRDSLLAYRNKSAAHLDWSIPRIQSYPKFDVGLLAVYYYYDWLIENDKISETPIIYPNDIRAYSERYKAQSVVITRLALDATKDQKDLIS